MKDARGHGSNSRGSATFKTAGLKGVGIGGQFSPGNRSAGFRADETKRTISDLRGRMAGTGPGHAAALWQGIKNLAGGSR